MSQFWSDVVSGFVAGISTTIFWAIFAWGWTISRDRKILREVEKSIVDFPNVGFNRIKFPNSPEPVDVNTFTVRNETPWSIVVRKVVLTFDAMSPYTLAYLGKFPTEFESHVLLKAYTSSEWGAPFEPQHGQKLTAGHVEIEYKSPLGATRLRTINLSAEQLKILHSAIAMSRRRSAEQKEKPASPMKSIPSDLASNLQPCEGPT
jgi:hypothetical protein